MAMLTVRNIPEGEHRALRARAARRGHSMEAEVREILAPRLAIATADGYLAAIAIANGFSVATRHTAPFRAAWAEVIDPWSG